MGEIASAVQVYLREHLLASLIIAVVAGFAASKTVVIGKRGTFLLYAIIGLVGTVVGQAAVFYFGLREVLDELAGFRYLFDFFIAYVGSFVIAAVIHFFKPQ